MARFTEVNFLDSKTETVVIISTGSFVPNTESSIFASLDTTYLEEYGMTHKWRLVMARTNKDMSPRLRDNNRDRLFTKAKVVLGSVATAATAAGSAASAYALTVINKSVGTIEGVWRTTDAYAKIKDVSGTAIESSLETINNVLPLQTIPTSMLAVAAVASAVWTASQGYKHHELTREHQLLMPLPPLTAPAHANIGN